MTIGEKIQYYRKQKGLSQEELGSLLTVSRQTVSQWETGQTSPTIDNLARLKDVLGISVDELLSPEVGAPAVPTEAPKEDQPLERYETLLTAAEADTLIDKAYVTAKITRFFRLALTIPVIVAIVILYGGYLEDPGMAILSVSVPSALLIFWEVQYHRLKKYTEDEKRYFAATAMTVSLYDGYLTVDTAEGESKLERRRYAFEELSAARAMEKYFVFLSKDKMFCIRKEQVPPDSRLERLAEEKLSKSKKERISKTHFIVLWVQDLLAVYSVCALVLWIAGSGVLPPTSSQVLIGSLLASVAPIALLVHILVLLFQKKNGMVSRLIGVLIILALLLWFTVTQYQDSKKYYNDDKNQGTIFAIEFLEEVEATTKLSFPVPTEFYHEWMEPAPDMWYVSECFAFWFEMGDLHELLLTEANGECIWLEPMEAYDKAPFMDFLTNGERGAFYNVTKGEWNSYSKILSCKYLLFACDYMESIVYIYTIEIPANDEINLSSFCLGTSSTRLRIPLSQHRGEGKLASQGEKGFPYSLTVSCVYARLKSLFRPPTAGFTFPTSWGSGTIAEISGPSKTDFLNSRNGG